MELPTGEDHLQDVVDPVLRAHISSLCSALGGSHTSETGEYVLGDDAFACLKDLKRWLKGYDEKLNRLDVARVMAECHLVTGDLLEIIAAWPEDQTEDKTRSKLALACVELLVPLTWPLDKNPAKMTVNHYKHMGVLEYAQAAYKKAILHHPSHKVLKNCVRACLPSMSLTPAQRTERDEGIIKLVLYLIRNIAMIKHPNPSDTDTGEEISRDSTIEVFHQHNIFDLLVMVSSQMGEEFNTQDTVIMEIIYHLVKGVDSENLFLTEQEQVKKGNNSQSQLESLLLQEKALKVKNNSASSSRHSRFGTTLWVQKQDGRRVTVSGQDVLLDKSKGLAKMNDTKRWKKPRAPGKNLVVNDFDLKVKLKRNSKKQFKEFVEQFLDAGFNPLFNHIRRAIEREAERILLETHPRQFLFLVSWFLGAERMRRKNQSPEEIVGENISFEIIASVLNQETLILLKKYMSEWFDMKQWTDLEAGMRCMIQLLLTVQDMALSPLEEDQDIAENMQNRIFYEESTLELILTILRNFKGQGFGYLDTCTELAHVHLRLLERYSKQNTHIFIKSKRQTATRKKAAATAPTENAKTSNMIESDDEVEAENARLTRERAFDFIKYETKFLSQSSIDTYIWFLGYYRELEYIQIKRALAFLHRVFVKRELEAILFRLDVLELMNRMVQGPDALPRSHPAYKEVHQFAKYYIKQLVKKLQKVPALYVELLFSKTNRSHHFIQYGHEPEQRIKKPRQPAELEVSPKLSYDAQVGVAVSVLINENKDDVVDWLKTIFGKVIDERQSWENEATARRMEEVSLRDGAETQDGDDAENSDKPAELAPVISLVPDTEERKLVLSKDQKVIMLLRLLGLRALATDGPEGSITMKWEFPPSLSSAELKSRLALLKKHTDDPPVYEDGQTAEDFIRKKAKPRPDRLESSSDDSNDDDDDDDDDDGDLSDDDIIDKDGNIITADGTRIPPLDAEGNPNPEFEPNLLKPKAPKKKKEKKKKHKRRRRDAEGKPISPDALDAKIAAKKQRDEEKAKNIKSALYVDDEDDMSDAERDSVFFAKEKELRILMEATGGMGFPNAPGGGKEFMIMRKKKRKQKEEKNGGGGEKKRKRRKGEVEQEEEEVEVVEVAVDEDEDRIPEDAFMETGNLFFSEEEEEDEEMRDVGREVSTSPPPQKRRLLSRPEKSVESPAKEADEDDEDDEPSTAPKAKGARRRQVVESDSE